MLIIGFVLAFYGSEIVARIHRGFQILRKIPSPNHTYVALAILLLGLVVLFSGKSYLGEPTNILLATFLFGSAFGTFIYQFLNKGYILSERIEKQFFRKHETKIDRFLEMVPGLLTWAALLSPIWLSFTLPFAVAYIIILADIYWLFSSFKYTILVYIGYRKMNFAKKQNWLEKLKKDFPDQWNNYYHLIMIPTYKESLEILVPAFEAIIKSTYPKEKLILCVGFEGRDTPEKIEATTAYLKSIEPKIGKVITTIHPHGLPGEVPGQGSNKNWMVNKTLPELKKMGISPKNVFITTLDADFVVHPQFLGGALHKYLSTPEKDRDLYSYTGVFLFHNNYWQSPAPTRLIATGTAFWQLSEMVGSDKYINYSSMSINLQTVLNIGLWIPNKVNDDSGFYWKAFYQTKGRYKVLPHFMPLTADAVLDVNLYKTFQNQYLQLKRWAYGVEHIPFIFKQYFRSRDIDFWNKTDKLTFIFWSYFKWGTLALFITFGGMLIPLVNPHYADSVISKNLSIVASWILTIAFIGLFSTVYINEKTAPKRPANWSLLEKAWSYIQWLLIPVVLVTITTIPAIDAQTSLMLGRYIEFRVTNKAR